MIPTRITGRIGASGELKISQRYRRQRQSSYSSGHKPSKNVSKREVDRESPSAANKPSRRREHEGQKTGCQRCGCPLICPQCAGPMGWQVAPTLPSQPVVCPPQRAAIHFPTMQYHSNATNFLEPRLDDNSRDARSVSRREDIGHDRRQDLYAKRIDVPTDGRNQAPSGFNNIKLGRQNHQHSGGAIAEYAAMAKTPKW